MKTTLYVCVLLLLVTAEGKRFGGGGGSRRGGSSSRHRYTPAPPPPPKTSSPSSHYGSGSSGTFLNAERAGSTGGTTHNRGNPFSNPPPQPHQTNGPVGFERFGNGGNQGSHQLGFDKVNSQSQNKPNSYTPSAPPGPVGPPPVYPGTHSTSNFGGNDHPPAYPGRPVNAPPMYTPNNQQFQGQQQFGNGFPHQNQHGNPGYGMPSYGNPSYSNPSYGNPSYGSYPGFGNAGGFPGVGGSSFGGGTFGGGYHPNTYQGNTYGGSPFGGGGYNGNPYYSPNNFGYSNNPGYFGGYPGQYNDYHKKSRFGGLPIPIPIPIPIPFGGGFGGGFGGFGGGYGHSYNHRVLHSFIKNSNSSSANNSSTSVFLLNNSTVTPCTNDHFVYGTVKVTTMACTAESCTAVKVLITTNVSNVVTVHGGSVTLCLEGENATVSNDGEIVTPTVSEIRTETLTVCRNVSSNVTSAANHTSEETTTTTSSNRTSEEATTTTVPETTTAEIITTTIPTAVPVNSTVCENVNCSSVEMCLPAVEVVDACPSEPCPFRRTGYKPCVIIKMCKAPSAPVSTFATLNTTISKIDEYNNHQSVHDAANLTLISYHPPVIPVFNVTNATTTTPPP